MKKVLITIALLSAFSLHAIEKEKKEEVVSIQEVESMIPLPVGAKMFKKADGTLWIRYWNGKWSQWTVPQDE